MSRVSPSVATSTSGAPKARPAHNQDEGASSSTSHVVEMTSQRMQRAPSEHLVVEELQTRRKAENEIRKHKNSDIRSFYKNQNSLIDTFVSHYHKYKPVLGHHDHDHDHDHHDRRPSTTSAPDDAEEEDHRPMVVLATGASFSTNVVLLVLKIVATALSGSMSVLASAADSLLDLISGFVLVAMHRATQKKDPYKYPEGKSRIEPIGIILFSCLMGVSSLQIMIEALKVLGEGLNGKMPKLGVSVIVLVILGLTIGSKFLLYIFCRFVAQTYGSNAAEVYSQDHRNDVVTNMVGVLALLLAYNFNSLWFLDSLGAIVISAVIIVNWVKTGSEHVGYLAGTTAPPKLLQELTFIAFHHSTQILEIDTVRAYHFGSNFLVELDIVLPEDMPLREAHDIGESLQIKLEELDHVQRAFVHLDYESTHKPEHKTS